jgi:adenine deaminase
MESMVKAGLTPSEVITAATRNSAQILGLDQLGMVATGKNANFLVLDANPLDNIANTRRISRVYLRGGEVDRAALDAMATSHRAFAGQRSVVSQRAPDSPSWRASRKRAANRRDRAWIQRRAQRRDSVANACQLEPDRTVASAN